MRDDERRWKILAIIWPITAFVTMGFEHSIANMFLIPHGMLYGADVSVSQMLLGNILPVATLGKHGRTAAVRNGRALLSVRAQQINDAKTPDTCLYMRYFKR